MRTAAFGATAAAKWSSLVARQGGLGDRDGVGRHVLDSQALAVDGRAEALDLDFPVRELSAVALRDDRRARPDVVVALEALEHHHPASAWVSMIRSVSVTRVAKARW
jgi:hypothetical protein